MKDFFKKIMSGKVKAKIIAILVLVTLVFSVTCWAVTNFTGVPKTTLMIYMVGSDLESKGAAASNDLEEILNSKVNLRKANVVVYAGGTTNWHNDIIEGESKNTMLQLKKYGFEVISSSDATSMGDAESLSDFLNYCYNNYKTENYSLIMWNHGNGPVIGYGKDILFDDNSLTLAEMDEALEKSPFNGENKLEWVGFDACLMASAELSYIWADHAKYLVASQEVEPSFGWDYSFLKKLGGCKTETLISTIVDKYYGYCKDYYESKDRVSQFTTLSCTDLSYVSELEGAVNNLFERAEKDIKSNYNLLVAKRVGTHSLGRASTNFDYDLIDLYDAAEQLETMYPDEVKTLCDVLDKMIIKNMSDTESCHGMSIYYPFYNKMWYEDSWGDIYSQFGFFDGYQDYLESYQEIWFSSEEPVVSLSNIVLQEQSAKKYTLQLTDEQNETFADAAYFILKREGDGVYTTIFSSHNVTNNNGLLTTEFDGKVIYAKNDYGEYLIPASTEHDTVGDYTRYSIHMGLSNYDMSGFFYSMFTDDSKEEYKVEPYRFQLALNNKNGEINTTALVPYDMEADANTLADGKLEDADLSQWNTYNFVDSSHIYPARYDNGALKPISQWITSPSISWVEMPIGDGLEFRYDSLAGGEYYILFEVEDTYNNKFCSELLPIKVEGGPEFDFEYPKPLNVKWKSGEKIELYEKDGVAVYIKTMDDSGKKTYTFEAENTNDFPVVVSINDIVFNENVCFGGEYFEVEAKSTGTLMFDSGLALQDVAVMGVLDNLKTIDMNLDLKNKKTQATIVKKQHITVKLSDLTAITTAESGYEKVNFTTPCFGARANEQVVFDSDGIRVTLMGFGKTDDFLWDMWDNGFLCIENYSDEQKIFSVEAMALNNITTQTGIIGKMELPPGCKYYEGFSPLYMDENNISAINSMKFGIALWEVYSYMGGFGDITWCDVKLAQKASQSQSFEEGSTVLFDEHGVRICLKEYDVDKKSWNVTIVNDTDDTFTFDISNVSLNSTEISSDFVACASLDMVGPHQSLNAEISYYGGESDTGTLTFTLVGMDFSSETVLFVGNNPIKLNF